MSETQLTIGKRYTFCPHYPNGYVEPFKCEECEKLPKTVYTIVGVTQNSVQIATEPNGKPLRIEEPK